MIPIYYKHNTIHIFSLIKIGWPIVGTIVH